MYLTEPIKRGIKNFVKVIHSYDELTKNEHTSLLYDAIVEAKIEMEHLWTQAGILLTTDIICMMPLE